MKLSKKYKKYLPLFLILLIGLGVLIYLILFPKSKENKNAIPDIPGSGDLEKQREDFKSILASILLNEGYSQSIIKNWIAISAFETANFQSNLFMKARNPWGMKLATVRNTTAIGETKSGFAVYRNYIEAINDLIYYMDYFNYPKTGNVSLSDQIAFMKSVGYFEEPFDYYYTGAKTYFNRFYT